MKANVAKRQEEEEEVNKICCGYKSSRSETIFRSFSKFFFFVILKRKRGLRPSLKYHYLLAYCRKIT